MWTLIVLVAVFLLVIRLRQGAKAGKTSGFTRDGSAGTKPADVSIDTNAFEGKSKMEFEITAAELKALREQNDGHILVDVREAWELQTASVAGARHIPMGEMPARAHQELDPEQHIVVMCHHGVRSMNVTAWLRNQGFEKAQSLAGGIDRWAREVDPQVPLY